MADDVAQVWRPGEVILDLYEVREVIRTGGMGLVYRVLHRGWNVELAVKVPRPNLVAAEQGMRDFEAEAATWVGLGEHPHTVNCVYVRRLGGVPRVFAEWLDGGSLAEAVRDGGLYAAGPREGLRRILDIAVQTAWGLEHAHRHGLVHQDVKPANVLLGGDGMAKVTDFGLAKARAAAGESTDVPPGTSVLAGYGGMTPAYCSPEQAEAAAWTEDSGRPRTHLTRASDTWSWALTVLEMFVGHPPCQYGQTGAEAFATFVANGGQNARIPALPERLVALLERCFVWEPAQRPKDMGGLARELVEIYAEVVGEPYPRPEPRTVARLADELSNQALSMLDLGRVDEAGSLWRRAAQVDPRNPHVVYNRGLHLWRTGVLTDAQVINDLEAACAAHPEGGVGEYLLGLVHLERGDAGSAGELLRSAARRAPGSPEITDALELADRTSRAVPPVVLTGHTDWVTHVAVSGDGRTGVSAARDGTLRIWDLAGRRCVRVMTVTKEKEEKGVHTMAIDVEARRAVVADLRGPAKIWDLRVGRPARVLTDRVEDIPDLSIHPSAMTADGRSVVAVARSGHASRKVCVWDASTGRCLRAVTSGRDGERLSGLQAVSADGRVAVSINMPSGGTHVWDTRTGVVLRTFEGGHFSAGISADGRTVVTQKGLGNEARLQVWELPDGRERCTVSMPGGLGFHFAVSADGNTALRATSEALELWDLTTGRCVRTWRIRACKDVAMSLDGRLALAGDGFNKVTVIELPTPGPVAPWSYPLPRAATDRLRESEIVSRALDRTTKLMAEGRFDVAAEEIREARAVPGYRRHRALLDRWQDVARAGRRATLTDAWLRDIPPIVREYAPKYPVLSRVSGAGSWAVTCGKGGDVEVWDLTGGQRRGSWKGHTGAIRCCVLSGDDRIVLTAGEDATVRVWEVESGRCRHVLRGHAGEVHELALSADGRMALSAGDDAIIRAWDVETGACVRELTGHTAAVYALQMSADGRYAVSLGADGAPRIWDVPAGRCLHLLPGGHGGGWSGGAYLSGSGDVMLSGHEDGTVQVWDVSTGRPGPTMSGHEHFVIRVTGSADGGTGVSVSIDSTRIWDLRTGRQIGAGDTGKGAFTGGVVVSPDGRFAVTGGFDDRVRIWDLHTGTCLRSLEGHSADVKELAIGGDGRIVTSSDGHGVTLVWELDWEREFPENAPRAVR